MESVRWVHAVITAIPGEIGIMLRRLFFRALLKRAGPGLRVERGTDLGGLGNIEIGTGVSLGRRNNVQSHKGKLRLGSRFATNHNVSLIADFGNIEIGDNVIVGMNSVFRASNHIFSVRDARPFRDQGHEEGTIRVGNNVWIGANVVVVAGADIGNDSVVAAGSVVTGAHPPRSLLAGAPARVVREIS